MKITVRCFLIPADITFNTEDVAIAATNREDKHMVAIFNAESEDPIRISIDREHYLAEKSKVIDK